MATDQPLDTPLWTFSLAVYGSNGVAEECLDLQERLKLDVNLLLFAAFVGAVDGVSLNSRDIAAASAVVADWHSQVVRSLRRARRALKPPSNDAGNPLQDASAALRAEVKAAELQSEKIEQAMLWQWSRQQFVSSPRGDRAQALSANLHALLVFYGVAADQAEPARIAPRLVAAAAGCTQSAS